MKAKAIIVLLCLFFQCFIWSLPQGLSFSVSQGSQIIYVPDDYPTIQAGVNAALSGDTIIVQSGIYYEHVVVNKSISLVGEHSENSVIDGEYSGRAVLVTSSSAAISNLTMRNSVYGIIVQNANNVILRKNNVFNNTEGITLYRSGNCTITENNSSSNANRGIFVNLSWDTIVYRNIAINNTDQYGINANASRNIALLHNTAIGNGFDGIGLLDSIDCIVWNNNISDNIIGIYSGSSSNSVIYHNIIVSNSLAATGEPSEVTWDSGYPSGGNYWSNYNFTEADLYSGPYQNETGSDGIGDTPYNVTTFFQDRYPLMTPRANGSALFFALQDRIIMPGEDALIYGFLWPNLMGIDITVLYRQLGETGWHTLETIQTLTNGKYSYLWSQLEEGTYELKATWEGNSTTFPTESLTMTLTVRRLPSSVTLKLNPHLPYVQAGTVVTIDGSISPTRPHINVSIWFRLSGQEWTLLKIVETFANGSYSTTWLATIGEVVFDFKSGWLGDDITNPANSSVVPIAVRKVSSSITINANSTTATFGSNIAIDGNIDPSRLGVNVTIQYNLNGTWNLIAIVTTDSNSNYSHIWQPPETGAYQIKASWQGDEATIADSKTISVTIQPKAGIPSDFTIYIIIAVVVTLIIIGALIYLRKKR